MSSRIEVRELAASPPRKITLRDVAERAGVSVPTVSKVISGRTDVSPETRARVSEILRTEGYRSPGSGAGTRQIELHFDFMRSTNNLQIMEGALRTAAAAGIDVIVRLTPSGLDGPTWAESMHASRHTGLILVTSRLDVPQQEAFARAGIPLVVIDPVNTPQKPVPSIGVNNYQGGFTATQHLIELGHRRIAIIQGISSECSQARTAGYHAALQSAGIPIVGAYEEVGEFRYEEGREAGLRLLQLPEPPTGIFAANDLEALGVLDAARSLRIGVPDQLSVVGFDDAIQARSAAPSLTTIRQPFEEIGSTAVHVVARLLEDGHLVTHRLELATELVIRESSGPAPETG